ncbi:MAG TPA: prepilin-type N-terminal cleavage/methylation domain-containing protein [Thermoanaerobaculia bacterium]|nr:prepilin-type N-terminal cleavage/methylation domain-containing protein [Thermoanaerobaculia bacterium]
MRQQPIEPLASADRQRHERGFSLIEVLIASVILLFVALGVITLFTMSASSNLQGSESTKAANYARERLELLWQVPFSDPQLTITGSATDKKSYEYYDAAPTARKWVAMPGPTPPVGATWTRITTIRQFAANDLATPINGDVGIANPQQVQMKEIKVEVHNARVGGALGGGKELTLLAYRSA